MELILSSKLIRTTSPTLLMEPLLQQQKSQSRNEFNKFNKFNEFPANPQGYLIRPSLKDVLKVSQVMVGAERRASFAASMLGSPAVSLVMLIFHSIDS